MTILVLVCALAFTCGAILGKNLAAIGITSDNALQNCQKPLVWLLISVMPLLGILVILDKLHLASILPQIFPSVLLIYLAGYFNEIIVGMGCFFLGLLLLLESSRRRSQQKIVQLMLALSAISFALSILLFFLQPVQAMVAKPKIINGVVMQTTPYTCAPASIATLARVTKKYPAITEKDVVTLTKTNRFGTTTLKEIKAMEKLELNPEYRHNLTVENLISLNKPALLHVKEKRKKGKGVRFSHAVALLSINSQQDLILIANPLYGLQIKTFEEFGQYWFGEAILVNLEQARITHQV